MASSVTLPGGGTVKYSLPVGADASAALTTAIKSEFTAAGKNTTMNVVDSKAAGKTGFFNAVLNKGGAGNVALTAGTGVQAIFDIGTGKDTLTGSTSTTLIYGNATATKGDAINVAGKTTVFGTAGNDTLTVTNGNATAYLEGGTNSVVLKGTADTISIAGTGNAFITVNASTKATIVGGSGVTDVTLSTGKSSVTGGSGKMSVVGGTGAFSFTHGKSGSDTITVTKATGVDTLAGALGKTGTDVFNLAAKAGGKFDITSFSGSADKIVIAGATTSQITAALKTAHTVKAGGSVTTTLTIGTDKITVVGGALTKTNFT